MSAETIPSEVATDLDCIRWYVECLDAVAFKRRAVAGLAEAEGSYNAAMKRLTDLSTLEAERARADAAEQRAADALARAEKAEGALAEAQGALVDLADWLENDCGAELPHSHIEKQVALARSDARASREAQAATDGGEADV